MQNKMKKTKKGFTLVELMVVLAILGILAAIAIPKYNQVKAQAAVEADINTANTIIHAARMQVLLNDKTEAEIVTLAGADLTKLDYLETTAPAVQSGSGKYVLAAASGKFTVTFTCKHTIDGDGNITSHNGGDNSVVVTEGSAITTP